MSSRLVSASVLRLYRESSYPEWAAAGRIAVRRADEAASIEVDGAAAKDVGFFGGKKTRDLNVAPSTNINLYLILQAKPVLAPIKVLMSPVTMLSWVTGCDFSVCRTL